LINEFIQQQLGTVVGQRTLKLIKQTRHY